MAAPDHTLLSFRPLARSDLPLLHVWLNRPHVLEWWDNPGPSLAEVQEEYDPPLAGSALTRCYLVLHAGRPIGFIQEYLIRDHPDYARQVQVEDGAAGIDLFIGEPEYLHRGLGPALIRSFLREIVFTHPEVTCCVIGPSVRNTVAIRAYHKAGFVYLKTVTVEGEEEPEYLMRLDREMLTEL